MTELTEIFMHIYTVKFSTGEGQQSTRLEARDPGCAFAKCQRENPGAIMLECVRQSTWQGQIEAITRYEPPPVQRDPAPEPKPFRMPAKNDKDGAFPFYDEVVRHGASK